MQSQGEVAGPSFGELVSYIPTDHLSARLWASTGAILFFPWFAAMCCYYAWLCKDWNWGKYINKQFAIIFADL